MGPRTARVLKVEGGAKGAAQAGRLAHKAAVVLNLADWSESSRKQALACYTSARHQASRCDKQRWRQVQPKRHEGAARLRGTRTRGKEDTKLMWKQIDKI